jgi:hypothetical protein
VGFTIRDPNHTPPRRTPPPYPVFPYGTGEETLDSTSRSQNLVILYDRMTPARQARLVERFVILDPDRLVELTALRSKLDKKKLENRD